MHSKSYPDMTGHCCKLRAPCPRRVHVFYHFGADAFAEGIPALTARTLRMITTPVPAHFFKNQTWYPAC